LAVTFCSLAPASADAGSRSAGRLAPQVADPSSANVITARTACAGSYRWAVMGLIRGFLHAAGGEQARRDCATRHSFRLKSAFASREDRHNTLRAKGLFGFADPVLAGGGRVTRCLPVLPPEDRHEPRASTLPRRRHPG